MLVQLPSRAGRIIIPVIQLHTKTGRIITVQLPSRAGRIITVNNMDDVDTYPPRYGDNPPVAKHRTRTDMLNDRVAEKRNASNAYYNEFRKKNPLTVPEKYENFLPERVRDRNARSEPPRIKSILDRAEADHQHARVRAGLLPIPTNVNPEKEDRKILSGNCLL